MGEIRRCDSPLTPCAAEKHLNEGSDGVQLPERSVHLGHPRRQSGDFSAETNLSCSKIPTGRKCIRQECTCSLALCYDWERTRCAKRQAQLPRGGRIIGYTAAQPPRKGQIRSSSVAHSTSIQESPRCKCLRRQNNMFHRLGDFVGKECTSVTYAHRVILKV